MSMHRRQWAAGAAASALLLGGLIMTHTVDAKKPDQPPGKHQPPGKKKPPPPSPVYNPYPPGILPADIDTELARVLREIDGIEQEALAQLRALPPPVLTGQPPTLQGTGMRLIQLLGKAMNYDKNISPERNSACSLVTFHSSASVGRFPPANLRLLPNPERFTYRAASGN